MGDYRKALELQPYFADAHYHLGIALAGRGDPTRPPPVTARRWPSSPITQASSDNLAEALADGGRWEEALVQYRKALQLQPNDVEWHTAWATRWRQWADSAARWSTIRRRGNSSPITSRPQKNLAWLRATCPVAVLRDGNEAVELAQRANQLCEGKRPDVLDTLAAAYAEAGWFREAVVAEDKALELALRQGGYSPADALRARIAQYRAGHPFRQQQPSAAPRWPRKSGEP